MIIDFQHHFVPLELAVRRGFVAGERRNLIEGGIPKFTLHDKLYDIETQLRDLDQAGIDLAVLSCNLGWDAPLEECRLINERLSEIQAQHPKRFVGLAHAPVLEEGGLREVERAARELHLRGVSIASQVNGLPVDAPQLVPFYRTACALDLAVHVHPAMLPAGYAFIGEYDLARIVGRELDLQLAVSRVIAGRVMEEFPALKLVFAHFGGGIAAIRERLAAKAGRFGTLRRPFAESFDRLYFDLAGFEGGPVSLRCALAGIRPDRLLFATDYPQDFTGATTQTGKGVPGIRDYAGLVRELAGSEAAARAILGETAAGLGRRRARREGEGEVMSHRDLRDWMTQVEELGELKAIEKAHWDVEIGVITEIVMNRHGPALLFDNISGYPAGHRILANALGGPKRLAHTLGLPPDRDLKALLKLWQEKNRALRPIPPQVVKDGPVLEHVRRGEEVDLLKFPVPKWHEHDGGRYIGTGSVDITRDPDEGWVNLGCYRVMVHDRNHVGFYISPGKQGRIQRDKWFARGGPMPVAMSFGHDPAIFMAGSLEIPWGMSEYDWVGGLRGRAVDVIEGPITGLPVPAASEIVIEGFVDPTRKLPEGPFGEWTGYYASEQREEPVVEVVALYHRDRPILLGSPPVKPPSELAYYRAFLRAAAIDEELRLAGIPDVTGVWCHEVGGSRLFTAVAIAQRYPGHAKQAAIVASQCHAGAYLGRFTVVVDEDIDVMNLEEVMWAICTRCDPEKDIDILRRCWSGPLDPIIPPGQKGLNSRAIIDATRPFEWRDRFPRVAESSPERRNAVLAKWGRTILS